jgi:hypothetical protein
MMMKRTAAVLCTLVSATVFSCNKTPETVAIPESQPAVETTKPNDMAGSTATSGDATKPSTATGSTAVTDTTKPGTVANPTAADMAPKFDDPMTSAPKTVTKATVKSADKKKAKKDVKVAKKGKLKKKTVAHSKKSSNHKKTSAAKKSKKRHTVS